MLRGWLTISRCSRRPMRVSRGTCSRVFRTTTITRAWLTYNTPGSGMLPRTPKTMPPSFPTNTPSPFTSIYPYAGYLMTSPPGTIAALKATPTRPALCALRKYHRTLSSSSATQMRHGLDLDPPTVATNASIIPYLLADIGEGIKEVELLQWYVQPGDLVHEFDNICQVQSDKATVDISSRYHGVVSELGGAVGSMIQVGSPLLFLEAESDSDNGNTRIQETKAKSSDDTSSRPVPSPPMRQMTTTHSRSVNGTATSHHCQNDNDLVPLSTSTIPASLSSGAKVLTSPAVRKLAADYAIDLSTVVGTGPSGRICKHDVVQYMQQHGLRHDEHAADRTQNEEVPPTSTTSIRHPAVTVAANKEETEGEDDILQLKGYHRYMVQSMTQALEIPHMSLGDEVILDEIIALRQQLKDRAMATGNDPNSAGTSNVSMLAFLLKACSLALLEFPMLNASVHSLEHCELKIHKFHHLGVAMDTPRGLVVPAVQNVQGKSLLEIQADLDRLKECARAGQVEASVLNPTFTLSNVGALGVGLSMSAVLAPPQVAMGVVGRVQRVPRFAASNNTNVEVVEAVHVANVSWTGDHRFLDGATLARFHKRFASFLQDPMQILLHCK